MFPYGKTFDANRSNTFESHIRRTTPVGIFDNATPEGAFDLSGNAWTWTSTIYDQQKYPYPYKKDGREDIHRAGVNRVLRGGSWIDGQDSARAVFRGFSDPGYRFDSFGFRVVLGLRPPSLKGFSVL
jgi:formylglycine-generating enzyme required for sulfatase activity